MTLSTFFSFSGDNRSSLRVYICWHAQQQADGPLLQLPDDPPLYNAPGDSLDDSSIFSNNNVCVCGDDERTRRRYMKCIFRVIIIIILFTAW